MHEAEEHPSPDDDEISFLSELHRLQRALSADHASLSSRENGFSVMGNDGEEGGVRSSEEGKQRKIVYKVTLQPRLSEPAAGPEIPPQYLELFEKLQPRIIARGLASDTDSLRTLNRSLRPKMTQAAAAASINSHQHVPLKPPAKDREAPLRVLGGRRMPPEALAIERQLAPWSIRNRSMTLPATSYNAGRTSPMIPRSWTLPSKGGYGRTESERRSSFGRPTGRTIIPHLGSTERPNSASRAPRERLLRAKSFGEDDEVASRTPESFSPSFSPLDSSYRNYSQEIFRSARKLESFSSAEDEPEDPEFLRQLIGKRPVLLRSISVDLSGMKTRDQSSSSTSQATPPFVFNSSPTSCETISRAGEEKFRGKSQLPLHGMKRLASMQGLEDIDPSAAATSSSKVSNDDLSDDTPAPIIILSSHPLNAHASSAGSTASPVPSSETAGISRGRHFHPVVSACYENPETDVGTKLASNPDTADEAFSSSSPGVDLLFQAIARLSGHPETQMKPEISSVVTEKTCANIEVEESQTASTAYNDELDLNSSISFSADTELSELTDDSSAASGDHRWTAVDLNSCPDDGDPSGHHSSAAQSTRSDDSSNDGGQMQEEEEREDYLAKVSSKFVSKVTVLLRRPKEEQDQPRGGASGSTGGCRIQQLPIRQLKPSEELLFMDPSATAITGEPHLMSRMSGDCFFAK